MSWPKEIKTTLQRLNVVEQRIASQYAGREMLVRLLKLAAVSHEHLLVVGPPGTAKTEIVLRFAELIDAKSFHYLVTRYTEPSELFGPVDMEAFQKGVYRVRTDKMLPNAQIAFLDEIFHAGSPVLNALLTLLNERLFNNGSETQACPLITLIGATNHLADDPWLNAFTDRFALRAVVDPTPNVQLNELAMQGWKLEQSRIKATADRLAGHTPNRDLAEIKAADLAQLHGCLANVDLAPIQTTYLDLIRKLRAEGVELSDRRVVRSQKLIAAATLLRGARVAESQDLWPLLHCWTRPEQETALRHVLADVLGDGVQLTTKRDLDDIRISLDSLANRAPDRPNDAAVTAHLRSLNEIRQELLRDHPDEKPLLERVHEMIEATLSLLASK